MERAQFAPWFTPSGTLTEPDSVAAAPVSMIWGGNVPQDKRGKIPATKQGREAQSSWLDSLFGAAGRAFQEGRNAVDGKVTDQIEGAKTTGRMQGGLVAIAIAAVVIFALRK